MRVEFVSWDQAGLAGEFSRLIKHPKMKAGEALWCPDDSIMAASASPVSRKITYVKPTKLEKTAWQAFLDFQCSYHLGFEQFAEYYRVNGIDEVRTAIENGTARRRLKHYFQEGYLVLEGIKRIQFKITEKDDVRKLQRIIRICTDAMDLPIDDDSDIMVAMLLVPQDFKKMCIEQDLLWSSERAALIQKEKNSKTIEKQISKWVEYETFVA